MSASAPTSPSPTISPSPTVSPSPTISSWDTLHFVYMIVFLLTGVLVLVEIYGLMDVELNKRETYGLLGGAIKLGMLPVYLLSMIHQFKVYNGLHHIESNKSDWASATGGFVGTNLERAVRVIALCLLLLAFSKATVVVDLVRVAESLWNRTPAVAGLASANGDVPTLKSGMLHFNQKSDFYLYCIGAAFLVLALWGALATWSARASNLPEANAGVSTLLAGALSDCIAGIIWLSLAFVIKGHGAGWLTLLVMVFVILYALLIGWRVYREGVFR